VGKGLQVQDRTIAMDVPGDRLYVVLRVDTARAESLDWRSGSANLTYGVVMKGYAPSHASIKRYETNEPHQGFLVAPTGSSSSGLPVQTVILDRDASAASRVGSVVAGDGPKPATYTTQGYR